MKMKIILTISHVSVVGANFRPELSLLDIISLLAPSPLKNRTILCTDSSQAAVCNNIQLKAVGLWISPLSICIPITLPKSLYTRNIRQFSSLYNSFNNVESCSYIAISTTAAFQACSDSAFASCSRDVVCGLTSKKKMEDKELSESMIVNASKIYVCTIRLTSKIHGLPTGPVPFMS